MANYATLKAAIADVVKTNGSNAITGANLQQVLFSIVNSIGTDYLFAGVATPSTSVGTPDQNVFYITGAGTFANMGTSVTVPVGSIGVFKYNGSWSSSTVKLFDGVDDLPTAGSSNLVTSNGIDISKLNVDDSVFEKMTINDGSAEYDFTFVNKAIGNDGSITVDSNMRASTPKQYYVPEGNTIKMQVSSGYYCVLYCFGVDKDYLGYTSTETLPTGTYFFRVRMSKGNDEEITTAEAKANVHITSVYADYAGNLIDAVNGRVDAVKSIIDGAIIDESPNLVDPELILSSTIVNTVVGAVLQTSENSLYKTILDIPVKQGVDYTVGSAHRIAVIYDKNKIIRQVYNTYRAGSYTITPSIDGYVAIVFPIQLVYTWFGIKEDIESYIPYGGSAQDWLISKIQLHSSEVLMNNDSVNLVNPANVMPSTSLYNQQVNSVVFTQTNASYKLVLGIPVEEGVPVNIGDSHRIAIVYDNQGIIRQLQNTAKYSVYELTPAISGYLGIVFFNTTANMWCGRSSEIQSYKPYNPTPKEWLIRQIETYSEHDVSSILYGKSIYTFGDSVMHGEGYYVDGVPTGAAKILAEQEGMICTDYAVSGASVCDDHEHRSWIINQVQNASPEEPDFILFDGGINDLRFTTPGSVPTTNPLLFDESYIASIDKTVVSGGLEYLIYTLMNKYPHSILVYMTQHKIYGHNQAVDMQLQDVQMGICRRWGIPVLNMNEEGGLNLWVPSQIKLYGSTTTGTPTVEIDGVWYDATHCNGDAYKKFYVPKLRGLLTDCCMKIND